MELLDEVVAQAPGLTEPGLQIKARVPAKSRLPPRPMGAKPSSARPPGGWSRCGSAQPSSVDPALLPGASPASITRRPVSSAVRVPASGSSALDGAPSSAPSAGSSSGLRSSSASTNSVSSMFGELQQLDRLLQLGASSPGTGPGADRDEATGTSTRLEAEAVSEVDPAHALVGDDLAGRPLGEDPRGDRPGDRGVTINLPEQGLDLDQELAAVERVYIAQALSRTEQNRSRAADLLGVKRTTLVEKIKRLERLGLGDGLQ